MDCLRRLVTCCCLEGVDADTDATFWFLAVEANELDIAAINDSDVEILVP